MRAHKDDAALIRKQLRYYRESRYPYNNGLAETMVVMRRHTEQILTFNERWCELISMYSFRDQLSFDYAAWEQGIRYRRFLKTYKHQTDFAFRSHW